MTGLICLLLATLSIWDYPSRHPTHHRLARQFAVAVREGDTETMEETCRKGVALLPDDPTWHYNLACSLAYFNNRENAAFDELEKAIDLGFRNREEIEKDRDLKRLSGHRRYEELLEYADLMKSRPLMFGPMATVEATGVFGESIALGEQNMGWDFEAGCFIARMKMAPGRSGGNVGDLYMNRDGNHALLNVHGYPGLTLVTLDQTGRDRGMDLDIPNTYFPYPVFGNCSRAYTQGRLCRSMPRMIMTAESSQLNKLVKFYLSNQTWVYPANTDIAPIGTNGDLFASITPYWIVTAGRSWSDLPYLRAALEASRAFKAPVKAEIVRRGLLAPTIQTLIRKSLQGVTNEVDYLSARAHPSAFPPGAVETKRLIAQAAAMSAETIPPLAVVTVTADNQGPDGGFPELTYRSLFAWAYVLRSDAMERTFTITAHGAKEFTFVQTHGEGVAVGIDRVGADKARVTINRAGMSPTNRVDIAVFGRNDGTDWGAPSYISFARMDPTSELSDPVLTALPQPSSK